MEKMEIEAKTSNLPALNDFVHNMLEENGVPPKYVIQTELILEEIFVNIASYAYAPNVGMTEIECSVDPEKKEYSLVFKDTGKPFNPLDREDPDITLSAEERGIGGLGIFLTKKYMDKVEYKYENMNILTVSKKWE